ncbi:toxin glutamine deamidase domain-containing protein [Streptomyces anulatus]|uniref:toxin glutamine deamidase domain-containing protein n=1 Tax=Streptomyces anulatus TaxID=1892 RepID=UPI001C26C0E5|nr:toxin glutamine deamidase domain-containing protein [Streptomyces anulatus]
MCRSQAQGGRRCRGSSLAVRRATYAVKSSAASKAVNKALADGELDRDSDAYRQFESAHTSALRARILAREGDHDGAADAALDAKSDMNRAARLLRADAARRTEQRPPAPSTDEQIKGTLEQINTKYNWNDPAYSQNCTSVVQAYELSRRGQSVKAGPLEPERTGGRPLSVIEEAWGTTFTTAYSSLYPDSDGGRAEVQEAFKEPGSRGIVYVAWRSGGAHVFNVENVDGQVRFVDGQPNPPVTNAGYYFRRSVATKWVRLDDQPTPTASATARYLEP